MSNNWGFFCAADIKIGSLLIFVKKVENIGFLEHVVYLLRVILCVT